jgi:hypothetical protein
MCEYLWPLIAGGDSILPFPNWTAPHVRKYLDPPPGVRVERIRELALLDSVAAGAKRIWLIESYYPEKTMMDSVRSTLGSRFNAGETVTINDRLEMNPYA